MADQYATLVSDSSGFGNKPEKKIKKKNLSLSFSCTDSPKVACEALPGSPANQ